MLRCYGINASGCCDAGVLLARLLAGAETQLETSTKSWRRRRDCRNEAASGRSPTHTQRNAVDLRSLRDGSGRRRIHSAQVDLEQGLVLVALVLILFAQLEDLLEDLHVETFALGLGKISFLASISSLISSSIFWTHSMMELSAARRRLRARSRAEPAPRQRDRAVRSLKQHSLALR